MNPSISLGNQTSSGTSSRIWQSTLRRYEDEHARADRELLEGRTQPGPEANPESEKDHSLGHPRNNVSRLAKLVSDTRSRLDRADREWKRAYSLAINSLVEQKRPQDAPSAAGHVPSSRSGPLLVMLLLRQVAVSGRKIDCRPERVHLQRVCLDSRRGHEDVGLVSLGMKTVPNRRDDCDRCDAREMASRPHDSQLRN